ncbi:MAG TPA: MarR family transcriptional regulator [Sediminibacterium sp.]|nr:MarR family transcriptional regulator [Sediminibacterium sp.]
MIKKNLDASVIFHIVKFSETWKRNNEAITAKYGITTQQWLIMLLLAKDPNILYFRYISHKKPMMAKEIADALNVSRANVTNLLNILIQKKLIIRQEDAADARRKRLLLSRLGIKLINQMEKERSCYNKRIFSGFAVSEKSWTNEFIDTCLEKMNDVPRLN